MPQNDGKNTLKRFEFEFKGKVYKFNLNPEEFTQDEQSRSTVTQTKGGAWVDDFGRGLTSIYMKGSTGMKNGYNKFIELRNFIRAYMDDRNPGGTVTQELTFHNYTDGESWIVHTDPSAFKLYRSKSNPLLYMYEIRLICLREAQKPSSKSENGVANSNTTLSTLSKALETFAKSTSNGTASANALKAFLNDLKVLDGGTVFTSSIKTIQDNIRKSSTNFGEIDLQLSQLAVEHYRNITETNVVSAGKLDSESLLYAVSYKLSKFVIPVEVLVGIKMILLEVYAIRESYAKDSKSFSGKLTETDVERLIANTQWVTSNLETFDEDENMIKVISDLREIELHAGFLKKASYLFSIDTSESLKAYNDAGSWK